MNTQHNKMNTQLVVSAIGADQPGLVESLSKIILDNECNIEDSRMSVLGGAFAIIVLVSGNWSSLAKLEMALPALERDKKLTIVSQRTEPRRHQAQCMPYSVDVVSLDHPGIVHQLARFFSMRGINVQDMVTNSYSAAHTATPMFSVHMTIEVPAQQHISALREEFLDLCDELNLDGVMEPAKL